MKKLLLSGAAVLVSLFPAAGEVKLSDKLTRLASHLGEGGAHFSVTDSADDLKELGLAIDQILENLPEVALPPGLKVETLLGDLGLLAIEGQGSSAHQLGELWHNRSFLLTDGSRPGLLSVFGGEAGSTVAHDFAPAGADLVLETSLDLRKMVPLVRKIAGDLGQEAQVEGPLMEKMGISGMTIGGFLMDFTVRGTVVLWLDEEKTVELGPEMNYPIPHFAARLDNAGLVWSVLKSEIGPESKMVEADGEITLVPPDGAMETPIGMLEPRFVWIPEKKQLFFSLTEADLATCRGDGPRLTTDADFKRATEGFPEKSNGLAYASKDLLETLVAAAGDFSAEVPPDAQPIVDNILPYLKDLVAKGGFAGAYAVEDDGFLFVANLPEPMKGGAVPGLGGIFAVSMLAGVTTPLILRAQKAGDRAERSNQMKVFAIAQVTYDVDQGRYANSLEELVEAQILDPGKAAELTEMGLEILVEDGKPGKGDMLGFLPVPGDGQSYVVGFSNGSVRTVPGIEMRAIQQGQ